MSITAVVAATRCPKLSMTCHARSNCWPGLVGIRDQLRHGYAGYLEVQFKVKMVKWFWNALQLFGKSPNYLNHLSVSGVALQAFRIGNHAVYCLIQQYHKRKNAARNRTNLSHLRLLLRSRKCWWYQQKRSGLFFDEDWLKSEIMDCCGIFVYVSL
jgi:hypothetical protein